MLVSTLYLSQALVLAAGGSVSRILSTHWRALHDHSSRPRIAATAHSDLPASLAHRAGTRGTFASEDSFSRLFGLAPCGVYHAACITAGAVRSYRTFSPLPFAALGAGFFACAWKHAPCWRMAVSSLWHWPSRRLDAPVPGVTRHTAPRSPDFPPPYAQVRTAAIARPACSVHYTSPGAYQPIVPGAPLNGPVTCDVIQPP